MGIGKFDIRDSNPVACAWIALHPLDEVREDISAIAGTARGIAKKEPGFDVNFRPGADTRRDTVVTVQAFLVHLAYLATKTGFRADILSSRIEERHHSHPVNRNFKPSPSRIHS